jgi:hypothetical protein
LPRSEGAITVPGHGAGARSGCDEKTAWPVNVPSPIHTIHTFGSFRRFWEPRSTTTSSCKKQRFERLPHQTRSTTRSTICAVLHDFPRIWVALAVL